MNTIVATCLSLTMAQTIYAAAIFVITPTITSTYLRSDSKTLIPYTVTNNTNTTLNNITINPAFGTSANLSISNNTCNSLTKGSSCTFNLIVSGQNQPSTFTVSPEICAFNKTVCSQPILSQRLNINVNNINHPVRAFVGLSNVVYPVTLVAGGAGILGAGISGFNLSEPAGIAVNLAGSTAYVTDSGTNTLAVINTNTNKIIQSYNVGAVPAAVAISPNGNTLYVVNYNNGETNGTVSVLNASTGALLSTISIGNGPWGIAVTPDGSKLYVTNSSDNAVAVVNTATNTLIATILVGTTPLGVVASPDGTKVYVANTQSNTVSVILFVFVLITASVFVEPKLIYTHFQQVQPYFIGGLGLAWNHVGGYAESPTNPALSAAPMPIPFSGNTTTNLVYEVGVGLQTTVLKTNSNSILNVFCDYRFMNWGTMKLGTTPLQTTSRGPNLGFLKTQLINVGMDYQIA